jgi:hypothetical protein
MKQRKSEITLCFNILILVFPMVFLVFSEFLVEFGLKNLLEKNI